IIDRVDLEKNVRIIEMIDEKIPYPIGAANKVLLAFSEKEMNAGFLKNINDLERIELMEQLNIIKDKGYSISFGEKTKGTVSVAAPVFDL
ncbi:IclR family transcriptional regulator C-terminal domain-containing protein, partial [Lysinibacillus sp. D4A3_S15]|uniref:IclR family transcriptional regulator domain-containing protein n=1 Tax=Lysinibacillus sp. D4A3_S15 TaxID=2941227 RepID=UPI0024BE0A31